MNWILIAILGGSLLTSTHENEEQCLGRKAMLEKTYIGLSAKCVEAPGWLSSSPGNVQSFLGNQNNCVILGGLLQCY